MQYDVFYSISQTPVGGQLPSEREMFASFFAQVEAASELGYGVAWVAESHLSSEVQKRNPEAVIPHWQGEVGLNVDFVQLAHQVYRIGKGFPGISQFHTCRALRVRQEEDRVIPLSPELLRDFEVAA